MSVFWAKKKKIFQKYWILEAKQYTDLGENLIRGIKLVTTSRVISQPVRKTYSISLHNYRLTQQGVSKRNQTATLSGNKTRLCSLQKEVQYIQYVYGVIACWCLNTTKHADRKIQLSDRKKKIWSVTEDLIESTYVYLQTLALSHSSEIPYRAF